MTTKLHHIYSNADEKYVKSTVLYGNSNKLYVDAEHETEVKHDIALNLLYKGVLIEAGGTYNAVTSFKDSAGTLTVNTADETVYTVKDAEESF